jgi:hypothetical protein
VTHILTQLLLHAEQKYDGRDETTMNGTIQKLVNLKGSDDGIYHSRLLFSDFDNHTVFSLRDEHQRLWHFNSV